MQTRTVSQGTTGQASETWATTYTTWAAREPLSGSEGATGSDTRTARERWRWHIRRRSGVSMSPADQRILDVAGVAHNIIAALPVDKTGWCGWAIETERAKS